MEPYRQSSSTIRLETLLREIDGHRRDLLRLTNRVGHAYHRAVSRVPVSSADKIVKAIQSNEFTTAELVRLHHALSLKGRNTTSILGQYGEELVAAAYGGEVERFDKKSYDVTASAGDRLQVKSYSVGLRPGNIRSFEHDVITVCIDGETATVVEAKHYRADDLFDFFKRWYATKDNRHTWGGRQSDRFERGWTIARNVPFRDVTVRIQAAVLARNV